MVRFGKLRGRPVMVFSFEVPQSHGERIYDVVDDALANPNIVVGYDGFLYTDAESNAVLRVETHFSSFPDNWELSGITLAHDFQRAKVGGREFVVPYRSELQENRRPLMPSDSRGHNDLTIQSEFKDYRGYTAQSKVGYDDSTQGDALSTITFGEIIPSEKK